MYRLALILLATMTTGCSLAFTRGPKPPRHSEREESANWCTSTYGWPLLDIGVGAPASFGVMMLGGALGAHGGQETSWMKVLAPPAVYIASGVIGIRRIRKCNQLRREITPVNSEEDAAAHETDFRPRNSP